MAQPTYEWRPPERGWREQDLSDLPEDGNRYEIIDGSLHVTPPPGYGHQLLADEIRSAIQAAAPTGWWVIREAGLRAPGANLIPDITVLRPSAPRTACGRRLRTWHSSSRSSRRTADGRTG
ncbi:Uma2 family endonuclease [Micromonospora sp. DR5-3]|nr:Uma2 family endonuclease [Micromonospora sp. MP36]MCW3815694.1 Uma2 family endonuclease [Micromonospora sp. DR5-3]